MRRRRRLDVVPALVLPMILVVYRRACTVWAFSNSARQRPPPRPPQQRPPKPKPLEWFDPLREFGEISTSGGEGKPILLVLPGLDGSGMTAWMQYPELGSSYRVVALRMLDDDRSTTFDELAEFVAEGITVARESKLMANAADASDFNIRIDDDDAATILSPDAGKADGADENRLYLLGESMGAGLALEVAMRMAAGETARQYQPDGIVLVSPATGWNRVWLGRALLYSGNEKTTADGGVGFPVLDAMPDAVLGLLLALTSYQLFDWGQVANLASRLAGGTSQTDDSDGDPRRSPLLRSDDRDDYARNVVRSLPETALSVGPGTLRHRIRNWAPFACRLEALNGGSDHDDVGDGDADDGGRRLRDRMDHGSRGPVADRRRDGRPASARRGRSGADLLPGVLPLHRRPGHRRRTRRRYRRSNQFSKSFRRLAEMPLTGTATSL